MLSTKKNHQVYLYYTLVANRSCDRFSCLFWLQNTIKNSVESTFCTPIFGHFSQMCFAVSVQLQNTEDCDMFIRKRNLKNKLLLATLIIYCQLFSFSPKARHENGFTSPLENQGISIFHRKILVEVESVLCCF